MKSQTLTNITFISQLLQVSYIVDEHTLVMSDTIIFNNK